MVEIYEMKGFNSVGKNKKKTQIVLGHTTRNIKDYVSSLKYRYNGDNKILPHYIVSREGEIFNIVPPDSYTNYFDEKSKNKNSIIIVLENLGWLRKNPLDKSYVNWIGEKYSEEVYQKKWRGHYFWQPYTKKQMDSLKSIINKLCEDFDIPKKSVGHNVKIDNPERFKGITSLSNYDRSTTQLNPSFNFDIFINKIDNEHPV